MAPRSRPERDECVLEAGAALVNDQGSVSNLRKAPSHPVGEVGRPSCQMFSIVECSVTLNTCEE